MGKARQRAGESSPSLKDAVDWLVENTSEGGVGSNKTVAMKEVAWQSAESRRIC